MKVTFDTNVWQKVINPEKYVQDIFIEDYRKIKIAIEGKNIIPFISETMFTIEGINNKDRLKFVRDDKPNIKFSETDNGDGSIGLTITISPNPEIHPGNNKYAKEYLEEALKLGFNILSIPRIGGILNPEIGNLLYNMSDTEINKMHEVGEKIENNKAGAYHIMEIGFRYNPNAWYEYLRKAPNTESKKIDKAFAEWSDGDAVAAHIGINADYFCTIDFAKTAGSNSVLSNNNIKWLAEEYGFKTITPKKLAELI